MTIKQKSDKREQPCWEAVVLSPSNLPRGVRVRLYAVNELVAFGEARRRVARRFQIPIDEINLTGYIGSL